MLYGFRVYKLVMARVVGIVISLVLGSRLSLLFTSRLTRNQRDWAASWSGYDLQRPISGAHFCFASFLSLCKQCHLLRKKYPNTQACRGSIYIQTTAFSYSYFKAIQSKVSRLSSLWGLAVSVLFSFLWCECQAGQVIA